MRFVLALVAAVVLVACEGINWPTNGGGCNGYDSPEPETKSWCEGDIAVTHVAACPGYSPATTTRVDCTATPGHVCDYGGRCVVHCTNDEACELDWMCVGDRCQRRPSPGQPCDGRCTEGFFCGEVHDTKSQKGDGDTRRICTRPCKPLPPESQIPYGSEHDRAEKAAVKECPGAYCSTRWLDADGSPSCHARAERFEECEPDTVYACAGDNRCAEDWDTELLVCQ